MKFRTTLILFGVFLVLLGGVLFFDSLRGKKEDTSGRLTAFDKEDVARVEFKTEDGTIVFEKDDKGDWRITAPLEAAADKYEVDRLAGDFADLRSDRVVEEAPADPSIYGFPGKEVVLTFKDTSVPLVTIEIGMENPLDKTFFARRTDEIRVVLISSTMKSLLEKKVFDFRKKDIFGFDTVETGRVKLASPAGTWEAVKKEEDWWLESPFRALAQKSRLSTLLSSLSSLRAQEFVSENKTEEDLGTFGLADAEYRVTVGLPKAEQEVTLLLHKEGENLYATTSLSPKIIRAETTILTDLDRKIEELRDKAAADFFSWDAKALRIKTAEMDFALTKTEDGKWIFETSGAATTGTDTGISGSDSDTSSADNAAESNKNEKAAAAGGGPVEADRIKVDEFLRAIDDLEAVEFIDPAPGAALDFMALGLEPPAGEILITTESSSGGPKEIRLLFSARAEGSETIVLQNVRFDYAFRVKPDFLDKLPLSAADWKLAEKEENNEKK